MLLAQVNPTTLLTMVFTCPCSLPHLWQAQPSQSRAFVQALFMHMLGRVAPAADPGHATQMQQHVVSRFHDDPEACFSIHSICAAGAKYGLVPGRWMGPYALCRAVADIAKSRCPDDLQVTVIESGGGAPCIDPERCVTVRAVCCPGVKGPSHIAASSARCGLELTKSIARVPYQHV